MRDSIYKMINEVVEKCVNICIGDDGTPEQEDISELNNLLIPIIPIKPLSYTDEELLKVRKNNLLQELKEEAVKLYEEKEAEFPEPEHHSKRLQPCEQQLQKSGLFFFLSRISVS